MPFNMTAVETIGQANNGTMCSTSIHQPVFFSSISAVSISIKENPSLLAFNYYFLRYNIVCKYRPTIIYYTVSIVTHSVWINVKCHSSNTYPAHITKWIIFHATIRVLRRWWRNEITVSIIIVDRSFIHRLRPIASGIFIHAPKKNHSLTGLLFCVLLPYTTI